MQYISNLDIITRNTLSQSHCTPTGYAPNLIFKIVEARDNVN